VNLNNGDNNGACCSAFWVPPIKTHSWLPSCIAAWIKNELIIRGDLFVTIVEIHTLILDVCVCMHEITSEVIFLLFWSFSFIENAKNMILSKANDVIINKINLSQKLGSMWVQWFKSNYCEILIMLKRNQHNQITFSISSSGYYNSFLTAKKHLKLTI